MMITDGLDCVFTTERLLIRAFENNESERKFLHTQIMTDPVNIALHMTAATRPHSEKYVEWMAEQLTKAVLTVTLCLPAETIDDTSEAGDATDKSDDNKTSAPVPIGYLTLGWGGPPPGDQAQHRNITIGITVAAAHQNKGYGGEAINWALDWAFRFGGYHRVEILTLTFNDRAQKLYEKLGFVEEGRSRESVYYDRKWHGVITYGMLEHEWERLRDLDA